MAFDLPNRILALKRSSGRASNQKGDLNDFCCRNLAATGARVWQSEKIIWQNFAQLKHEFHTIKDLLNWDLC